MELEHEVLFASKLVGNVFSIGKFTNGFEIIFKEKRCEIDKINEQIAVVGLKKNLYESRTPDKINYLKFGLNDNCIYS